MRTSWRQTFLLVAIVAVLGVGLVYPILLTVGGAFRTDDGGFTLRHIASVFEDPATRRGLLNATLIAAITTTIAQGKALSNLFNKYSTEFYLNIRDTTPNISKNIDFIASSNKKLASITQIGDIRPLEISQAANKKAIQALAKMKNPYSIKFTG
jgi:ABC-type uncharacterized transport system permease subunit